MRELKALSQCFSTRGTALEESGNVQFGSPLAAGFVLNCGADLARTKGDGPVAREFSISGACCPFSLLACDDMV